MKIKHLAHSGFMIETNDVILIFDYYKGKIDITDGKKIYVFISHFHKDHFNPEIFKILEGFENVSYIISDDIKKKYNKKYFISKFLLKEKNYKDIIFIGANKHYEESILEVYTLKSTDEGVAFIVYLKECEKRIYHAGDLHLWKFEEDSKEYRDLMEKNFREYINPLKNYSIDIAFIPLDKRLSRYYAEGFDYLMKNMDIKFAIPMHSFSKYSVNEEFLNDEISMEYRDRVINVKKEGEVFEYEF